MKRNSDFGLYMPRLSNLATYAKTGNGTPADGFSLCAAFDYAEPATERGVYNRWI